MKDQVREEERRRGMGSGSVLGVEVVVPKEFEEGREEQGEGQEAGSPGPRRRCFVCLDEMYALV